MVMVVEFFGVRDEGWLENRLTRVEADDASTGDLSAKC